MFEFDTEKSRTNQNKHGIDFVQAQKIWQGPFVEFAAKSEFENRFAVIGLYEQILHTCVYTMREEKIRIISCRRARDKERKLYEEVFHQTKKRPGV